jgi:hypothetical protein
MRLRLKNEPPTVQVMHTYKIRPRKDHRGVDLISDTLSFSRLWYAEPNAVSNAVDYTRFRSRSCRAVIRVYDAMGNVIETHDRAAISRSGGFCQGAEILCEWRNEFPRKSVNC